MAGYFGNGIYASAFSVAYRLPNMFRNLLAEGTLAQSFMPLFLQYFKRNKNHAKKMSGAILSFLFLFLLFIFIVIFFTSPYFIPFLVGKEVVYSSLVIELTKILFFFIVTTSLSSIFSSIANSQKKFFVPSLSPILLNIVYLFVFLVCFKFVTNSKERIFFLSYSILFGGFLQLCLQAFYIYKLKLFPKINFYWKHPAIKKLSKLILPAVLGSGFYQFSLLVDIFLANYIQNQNPEIRAVVSLDYAQRLIQLPTGVIGVAIATTILPSLIQMLQKNQKQDFSREFSSSLTFSNFLTFPCMIGLLILPEVILNSIYFGGKWDLNATNNTVYPLMIYAAAVPFYSLNKILISSYFSYKNTTTPLKIQSFCFIFNILCNLLLISKFYQNAIATSALISSICNFFLLLSIFIKKYKIDFSFSLTLKKQIPLLCSSFVMAGFAFFLKQLIYKDLINYLNLFVSFANASRITIIIFICICSFIYFFCCIIFKSEEMNFLVQKLIKKSKRL